MAERNITNCSECAYVQEGKNGLWCPFHDVAVSNGTVCDDFMDEFQSPQWSSLIDGMNGGQTDVPQYLKRDILIYVLIVLTWIVYAAFLTFWIKIM